MILNNDIKTETEKCNLKRNKNGISPIFVEFDKNDFNNYNIVDPHIILDEDKDDKGRDKNKKKREEYNSIQFLLDNLYKTNEEVLINCTEKPDFIIKPVNEDKYIGIEVTKCHAGQKDIETTTNTIIEKLFNEVFVQIRRQKLWTIPSDTFQDFRIVLYHEKYMNDFHKNDIGIVKQEIKDWLLYLLDKSNKPQTQYICKIDLKSHKSFLYKSKYKVEVWSDMAFIVPNIKDLPEDPIIECIKNKNEKLIEYKKEAHNSRITSWWLCISIPDTSKINPRGYSCPKDIAIGYDKVFIVKNENFGFGVNKIYDTSSQEK